MNYTRILFTIVIAGVTVTSDAMRLRETEVVWVLKEDAHPWGPKRETHAVYVLREDADLLSYPTYDPLLWDRGSSKKVESYKEKLKRVQEDLEKKEKEEQADHGFLYLGTICEFNEAFARIALNSRDMPELEKLEYLRGACCCANRKEIIISLIKSGINPNHLAYQGTTALAESIEKQDAKLVELLLRTGVRPFEKDVKQAQQSSCEAIRALFDYNHSEESIHEYNGVFFKKSDDGDILPLWQDIPPAQLKDKLTEFVLFMQTMAGVACIIEVPRSQECVSDILKQTLFILHHADSAKTEWIYKNESSAQ